MLGSIPARYAAPEAAVRPFRLLAFGSSAGGIPALVSVLSLLPGGFPIPIVVIQHLSAASCSHLPEVLGWRTPLRCIWAKSGEAPSAGCVHVAAPGANLVLTPAGTFLTVRGRKPLVGWPSIDVFFKSMARHLGPEAIGIILSGLLYDGAEGIAAIRDRHGATMVLDPALARFPDMPRAARELGKADLILSLSGIAAALAILAECGIE
jgi:two-component system chemotaxis response regulator CheB